MNEKTCLQPEPYRKMHTLAVYIIITQRDATRGCCKAIAASTHRACPLIHQNTPSSHLQRHRYTKMAFGCKIPRMRCIMLPPVGYRLSCLHGAARCSALRWKGRRGFFIDWTANPVNMHLQGGTHALARRYPQGFGSIFAQLVRIYAGLYRSLALRKA